MGGVSGLVVAILGVCIVALTAVLAKAKVEIARIDARAGHRKGDVRR